MDDGSYIVVVDPCECAFCEYAELHESGHGYICTNEDSPLFGCHITSWGNYCDKFRLWEENIDE